MSNQIVITSGAKLRDLDDVIIGTDGILSSVAFNVANGVPRLDENGKILVSQLPNSVMEFKGVWNASTNSPTLVNGTGNAGDVWLCNVAGTVNFGAGPIAFSVGDYAVYTGTVWARSSGATGTVTSVGVSRDGNALTITGSPVTTSGTINLGFSGDNTQYINGAGNLTTFPTLITSIGLTMPAAFNVSNSPLTANGTIGVSAAGYASQYIRGDGTLADFPTSGGGGSSVSYYFNGGTSQGTIGGTTYYEMSKTADTGTGVDFNKTGDGFIVAFLTDANDPNLLQIPAGNWDFEIYASMSSNGGTPELYAELYKYDGTTFTLIATSSHEILYDGVNLNLYSFATAVPQTSLTVTDRLAIKLYADNSGGKTTTIHTQDSHLCQVITTFSTGLTALNGLTAQVQYFGTGTSGSDFNIVSSVATHTFNIPSASATARGLITTGTQTIAGAKTITGTTTFTGGPILSDTNLTYANSGYTLVLQSPTLSVNRTVTLPNGTGTLALTSDISYPVTSVFGRTGAVVATSGDYNSDQVTEGTTNLYFTNTRARAAISLTTTGSTGAATYNNTTGVLNIPNYADQYVGTVTSVAMSVPTGLSISGSPITTNGTLAVTLTAGYSIPTTANQSTWTTAYNRSLTSAAVTGTTTKTLTLNQQDGGTITASWTDINTDAVTSVFGRTGAVVATEGDYTLTQIGDVTITTPTTGQVLKYNGTTWINDTDANTGTVTSVAMTVPTGLSIAGSPITSSGTLAVTLSSGYVIPTQTTLDGFVTLATVQSITATKTFTVNQMASGLKSYNADTTDDAGVKQTTWYSDKIRMGVSVANSAYGIMASNGADTGLAFMTHTTASGWLERFLLAPDGTATFKKTILGNNGIALRGSIGANGYGRTDAQIEISNIDGGHALMSIYNYVGAGEEGAISWEGKRSNGSIYQMEGMYVRYVNDISTYTNYTVVHGQHLVDSSGDTNPFLLFSNNSVRLLAGSTSGSPWNTLPSANTLWISGNTKIDTKLTINGTDTTYNLDVTGSIKFTGSTNADIIIVRAGTSYGAGLSLYTNSTVNWLIGTAWGETSTNFVIYNYSTGTAPFKIDYSTNNITLTNSITANSIIKVGGTSSQFLKADGTVDSNTYALNSALANYLLLSGGVLTGRVTGTEMGVKGTPSNSVASGPWFRWINTAESIQYLSQLNANNGLDWWTFNGSWNRRITFNGVGHIGIQTNTPFDNALAGQGIALGANSGLFRLDTNSSVYFSNNTYYDGTNWKYMTTNGGAFLALDTTSAITFYSFASGTAGANVTFSERFNINPSGAVKINSLAGTGNRIVGSDSTGSLNSITVGSGLSLSSGVLTATGGSSGTVTGSGSSSQISFWTSSSNISGNSNFVWDNSNYRLGIKQASPSSPLDIYTPSTAGITPVITLSTGGYATSRYTSIRSGDPYSNNRLGILFGYNETTSWDISFSSYSDISFMTGDDIGASTTKARLKGNGNFLLGATTELGTASKLQVTGDINITGNYRINGTILTTGIGGSGTSNYLPKFTASTTIGNSSIYDNGTSVLINTSTATGAKLIVNSSSDGDYFKVISSNTDNIFIVGTLGTAVSAFGYMSLIKGGVNKVYLSANETSFIGGGNLLIGTSTDIYAYAKLQVNGTMVQFNTYNRQTVSYTLVLTDAGKIVETNSASANNVTIPLNSSVAFAIGTEITVMQYGTGQTTIVATSGVTLRSNSSYTKVGSQYTGVTLLKVGTNEWYIIGNLSA